MPINSNTRRVCSKRFINASGRYLPVLYRIPTNERKPPRRRLLPIQFPSDPSPTDTSTVINIVHVVDVSTQTEENFDKIKVELASARERILFLEQKTEENE